MKFAFGLVLFGWLEIVNCLGNKSQVARVNINKINPKYLIRFQLKLLEIYI
jgi:hypothetical protein